MFRSKAQLINRDTFLFLGAVCAVLITNYLFLSSLSPWMVEGGWTVFVVFDSFFMLMTLFFQIVTFLMNPGIIPKQPAPPQTHLTDRADSDLQNGVEQQQRSSQAAAAALGSQPPAASTVLDDKVGVLSQQPNGVSSLSNTADPAALPHLPSSYPFLPQSTTVLPAFQQSVAPVASYDYTVYHSYARQMVWNGVVVEKKYCTTCNLWRPYDFCSSSLD
jgi:hypothetical protein